MIERFETFTVLIAKISRNIRKIKNEEMAEYQLRSAHVSCLYYLYTSNGMTATDLCEKCEEDKATISRCLVFLEKEGYLLREANGAKRYKSQLVLTEKGALMGARIAERIDSVLEEISAEMTPEERIAFYRALTLVSDRLDTISRRYEK